MDISCQVRARAWRDGKPVRDIAADRLGQLADDPGELLWIDLVDPTTADLEELSRRVCLSPTAIEDTLAPYERPKLTRFADHLFLMVYATSLRAAGDSPEDGQLQLHRVSVFMFQRLMVTVRRGDGFDMGAVEKAWDANADLATAGVPALVHGLLDVVVDNQFDTIQEMDDALESLEDELFEEHRTGRQFQREIYGRRKDLVRLRRIITPMREIVGGLMRHQREDMPRELAAWYEDLYDHVLRATEWTESLRDLVGSVFETNLSLQDLTLNTVMKKLAGWAAVIAVPTAITGYFGQNVPYWGFGKPAGVWLSTISIVAVSVGLYAFLRHRDWV